MTDIGESQVDDFIQHVLSKDDIKRYNREYYLRTRKLVGRKLNKTETKVVKDIDGQDTDAIYKEQKRRFRPDYEKVSFSRDRVNRVKRLAAQKNRLAKARAAAEKLKEPAKKKSVLRKIYDLDQKLLTKQKKFEKNLNKKIINPQTTTKQETLKADAWDSKTHKYKKVDFKANVSTTKRRFLPDSAPQYTDANPVKKSVKNPKTLKELKTELARLNVNNSRMEAMVDRVDKFKSLNPIRGNQVGFAALKILDKKMKNYDQQDKLLDAYGKALDNDRITRDAKKKARRKINNFGPLR